jgi:transposase
MLALQLQRLQLIDQQMERLNSMIAAAMKPHQDAVIRLAEVPGLGVDSAQQIIAEVGAQASTFASAAELTSWVGTCPGKVGSSLGRLLAISPYKLLTSVRDAPRVCPKWCGIRLGRVGSIAGAKEI